MGRIIITSFNTVRCDFILIFPCSRWWYRTTFLKTTYTTAYLILLETCINNFTW